MKQIKILFISMMSVLTLFVSCEDDGGSSKLDLEVGAVPDIVKSDDYDSFIDFASLEMGVDVEIGFTVDIAQGDVASADIVLFYQSGDSIYGPVLWETDVKEFPREVVLTDSDIVSAFDVLTSTDDMLLSDRVIVSAQLYKSDGTMIKMLNDDGSRNYGSDIHSSTVYAVQIGYVVSCPSDLGGTYSVVSNGTSTEAGIPAAVDLAYEVVVSDKGGGSYTISDGVAGVYIFWYSGFGYDFETEGNFTDVCGTLTGSWVDGFGAEIRLTGIDNEDGTLSISWENDFGDTVEAIYTKK